jgi:hypothetical protein
MGSRSTVKVSALVLVSSVLGAATPPQDFAPRATDWQLVIRRASPSRASYWVGLRNVAKGPRAFCRLGITYEVDLLSGDTIGNSAQHFPSIGSPHPCAPEDAHLVLPGETHFVFDEIVIPSDADPAQPIRFHATAEQACVDAVPCHHIPILVSAH